MSDAVFVQGSSGSIIKMDVPTNPHALERYEAAIESQDLVVLDPESVVEAKSRWGGVIYQAKQAEPDAEPRKKAAAKKAAASTESPDKE